MRVASERLILREFIEEDFEQFYSVFSNQQVMRYALREVSRNPEDKRSYFDEILCHNQTKEGRGGYEFAVLLASTGAFVGFADVEVTLQNDHGGCGEIGYFLLPDYWGKGFATEIANTLLEFCFTAIGLHRVCASCNAANHASEHVMQKVGMTKEGEFDQVRFKFGTWHNELRYRIMKDEWSRLRNSNTNPV